MTRIQTTRLPRPFDDVASRGSLVAGIELQHHRLSMVVLDSQDRLRVVSVQHIYFDRDHPEFNTKNGVVKHPSPRRSDKGPQILIPVRMLVKALDALLDRCFKSQDFTLSDIRSVGICGPTQVPVLLTRSATELLEQLSPSLPLHAQLSFPHFFAAPICSTEMDRTGSVELKRIHEDAHRETVKLGSFAVHLAKVQNGEMLPYVGCGTNGKTAEDVWTRTGSIITAGALIEALLIGTIPRLGRTEAAATGLVDLDSLISQFPAWSSDMINLVSNGHTLPLWRKLGVIDGDPFSAHIVSSWLVSRYSFSPDCIVSHSLPAAVASYLSFLPDDRDVGLGMTSTSDYLVAPLSRTNDLPPSNVQFLPNPFGCTPWLGFSSFPGDQARRTIRDQSCNGRWFVFNTVVKAMPMGCQIGLDDKLYAITDPSGSVRRFQGGVQCTLFEDLRADARAVLEGQALAIRCQLGKTISDSATAMTGFALGSRYGSGGWARFDITDESAAPARIFGWGKAAGNEQVAKTFSQVLGAPFFAAEVDVVGSLEEDLVRRPIFSAPGGKKILVEAPRTLCSLHDLQVKRGALGAAMLALHVLEPLGDLNKTIRTALGVVQEDSHSFPPFSPTWLSLAPPTKEELLATWEKRRSCAVKRAAEEREKEDADMRIRWMVRRTDKDMDWFVLYGAMVLGYMNVATRL